MQKNKDIVWLFDLNLMKAFKNPRWKQKLKSVCSLKDSVKKTD